MFKLLKNLKPYRILIIINIILVSVTAVASLLLPDRMSNIINKGITEEVQYETTEDGEQIFVDLSAFSAFLGDDIGITEFPLPKFNYRDAGLLVTVKSGGKHYAVIDILDPLEKDGDGNIIYMRSLNNEGQFVNVPVPKFKRTVDGSFGGDVKQGVLVLQDNGMAQIVTKTKTVYSEIQKNGLIMLGIALLSSACSIAVAYLSSRIGMGFGRDIRKKIFDKVIGFSALETDNFGTASLITRATNDVTQVQTLIIMSLRLIVIVPVMFVGGLIMALSKSAQMTLVLAGIMPIVIVLIFIVSKKIIPLFKSLQAKTDKLTLISRENITGVRVIRAFGADERENARFDQANQDMSMIGLKAARIMSALIPFMFFIMSVTSLAIVLIGVFFVNDALQSSTFNVNTINTLGNMMAVIQYIMQIMFSVIMLGMIFINFPRASVSAGRINEVLDSETSIVDNDNPSYTESKDAGIVFENVSFKYHNAENNVLDKINFSARHGEVTAIIGSTGSGKSTLINLIPRLYDVTEGSIKINGVDIREYPLRALRSKIGFVPQKAVLFSGTVKDNIAYGNYNAAAEDIKKAAETAQAADFIEALEDKYDSEVEQNGANFSGGQKQRLSIARAIARKPEIYIFDDSFSALDFKTDAKLRTAIKKEIKDSTVFIVAQRIGTVMDADRIIVLSDGKIAGIGSHNQLLKDCAVYREIALSQLSAEELGLDVSEA